MPGNMLANASSPYLLQHASNPVHWREWGVAALAEARERRRPILLSIGYAACHWCHVMAHESFEDQETADLMNALFINIKVDREERPDIDHIYMSALHAQGQQGGWPLTMFLTPDGAPFWGGTYFPKTAQYGRAAFKDILLRVEKAFRENPAGIQANSAALTPRQPTSGPTLAEGLTGERLDEAAETLAKAFDDRNGGLRGAPKFPNPPTLDFLFRTAARTRRAELQEPVLLTLERMCNGGIYDHLGGGFARYSVDEIWLVPHFEKMLYDNAQLLDLLATAFQRTGIALFETRAIETVGWLRREMTNAQGAFCASLDADSDGVEGRFYVWTPDQIAAALGAGDAALFCACYDATQQGNWHDEHTGEPVSILNRTKSPVLDAATEDRLAISKAKLLTAWASRNRPGLDDKILADWNGLQISALVNAAQAFGQPDWLAFAADAFDFVAGSMSRVSDDGLCRLSHSWRQGRALELAFASDYVFMIKAALALHESHLAGGMPRDYLGLALQWARTLEALHQDEATGLLCTAAKDASDVIVRLAPTSDDAVPNPHGHYAMALVALAAHTGDEHWRGQADRVIAACAGHAAHNPYSHCSMLAALDYRLNVAEIVIFGSMPTAFAKAALALPFQNRIVVDGQARPEIGATAAGATFAVICVNGTCSLPIADPAQIAQSLAARRET